MENLIYIIMEKVNIKYIKEIVDLSNKSIKDLRNLNCAMERTYQGKELNKYELIYQIINTMDSPLCE